MPRLNFVVYVSVEDRQHTPFTDLLCMVINKHELKSCVTYN